MATADRPTRTVTTFDHGKLDRLVKALQEEVNSYDRATGDAEVRNYIAFGEGVIAALNWISGGSTGTRLYVLLEEAESILAIHDRRAVTH